MDKDAHTALNLYMKRAELDNRLREYLRTYEEEVSKWNKDADEFFKAALFKKDPMV